MTKHSIIRTIYLYLFSMVGLILIIIGTVNFLNMGFKAFVFTQVEKQDALNYKQPPMAEPIMAKFPATTVAPAKADVKLSVDDYNQVQLFIADYKNFQERQKGIDIVLVNREREASINLALILVGIPLYLYHWLTINREKKSLINQITS